MEVKTLLKSISNILYDCPPEFWTQKGEILKKKRFIQ